MHLHVHTYPPPTTPTSCTTLLLASALHFLGPHGLGYRVRVQRSYVYVPTYILVRYKDSETIWERSAVIVVVVGGTLYRIIVTMKNRRSLKAEQLAWHVYDLESDKVKCAMPGGGAG